MVGRPDPIKGQGIAAFVTLKQGHRRHARAAEGARASTWPRSSGRIAKPDEIHFAADLPKTRSGKIMRRLLRDIADRQGDGRHDHAGRPVGGRDAEEAVRGEGAGLSPLPPG